MQKEKSLNLQNARLPKMLGELMHSNQFLKVFSLSALVLVFMVLGTVMVMATKEPLVITLGPDGKAIERILVPKVEDQVREGIKYYLEKRYQWEPENVKQKLKETENFIDPSTLKLFKAAVSNIEKFSIEKIVSQRVYPQYIEVNLSKKTALVTGDRITTIQGLKAAGNLKLELSFELGSRTEANPWGLYIVKEIEE